MSTIISICQWVNDRSTLLKNQGACKGRSDPTIISGHIKQRIESDRSNQAGAAFVLPEDRHLLAGLPTFLDWRFSNFKVQFVIQLNEKKSKQAVNFPVFKRYFE